MAAESLYIQHVQHGGDASISIICAAVKVDKFCRVSSEKNLKMKIVLLICQELLLLLLLLLQLLLYYLHVPLIPYVTAINERKSNFGLTTL
jgi:hypothetical protein